MADLLGQCPCCINLKECTYVHKLCLLTTLVYKNVKIQPTSSLSDKTWRCSVLKRYLNEISDKADVNMCWCLPSRHQPDWEPHGAHVCYDQCTYSTTYYYICTVLGTTQICNTSAPAVEMVLMRDMTVVHICTVLCTTHICNTSASAVNSHMVLICGMTSVNLSIVLCTADICNTSASTTESPMMHMCV